MTFRRLLKQQVSLLIDPVSLKGRRSLLACPSSWLHNEWKEGGERSPHLRF